MDARSKPGPDLKPDSTNESDGGARPPGRRGPQGRKTLPHYFDRLAGRATAWAGSPSAFAIALGIVLVWSVSGPLFGYSETWQLVINTGTTIVTFLMVFLIQQSQNKDSAAVHLKLNELLASHHRASNHLICIEDLDEDELKRLAIFYRRLAQLEDQEGGVTETHSIDDAQDNHSRKHAAKTRRETSEAPAATNTAPDRVRDSLHGVG